MTSPQRVPLTLDPEVLLAHGAWLAKVARVLVVAGTVVGGAPLPDPDSAPDVACDFDRLPQAGAATTFRARFVDADSKQAIDFTQLEPPSASCGEAIRAVVRESGSDPRHGVFEYGCVPGELVLEAHLRGYALGDLRVVVGNGVTIADTRSQWPPLPNHSNDFSAVLAPGRDRVAVRRRGFQDASREFTVPAGEAVELRSET